MSIFGQLDAANIPTNPYFVEQGEYEAEVTAAQFKTTKNGDRQLQIRYVITDESSAFLDSVVTQFFTLVDPEMTQADFELLPANEKATIRKNNSALKRTLCGNENNPSQKGLGVNVDDLNDENWNPESLVGTKVDLAVNNYGATNEGVSVRWVNLRD